MEHFDEEASGELMDAPTFFKTYQHADTQRAPLITNNYSHSNSRDPREREAPPYGFGAPYRDETQRAPLIINDYNAPQSATTTPVAIAMETRHTYSVETIDKYDHCTLAWSLISIFCCGIFGPIALLMSLLGYTDHRTGDYSSYRRKRRCAIGFLATAFICGLVGIIVYLTVLHGYGTHGKQSQAGDIINMPHAVNSD